MTHTTSRTDLIHTPFAALRARLATAWAETAAERARRREYHRVRDELASLSTRDLNDIGITRGQIEEIARQHAYGG